MSSIPGYHNHKGSIFSKIHSLLILLTNQPSKYDELTQKIEYRIEYVLHEQFATFDELVSGVSDVVWRDGGSFVSVGWFFRGFHDAPHCSEQARTFVAQLCTYVLRWFAIASVEDFWAHVASQNCSIPSGGAPSFIRTGSLVGSFIEWGLLSHKLVWRHLIKPLTNHHNVYNDNCSPEAVWANAIYQLFTTAGNTLLQGLLEPADIQVCFGIFDTQCTWIMEFESGKLQVHHNVLLLAMRHIRA